MKVAVASGKGGTGKTTVATSLVLSLAAAASESGAAAPMLLDCDVEGPNAHLFLAPHFERRQDVAIQVPQVDVARCTACGKCAAVCQYHAIVVLGKRTLVFPQLCHGCGSCTLTCPEGAIREEPNVIGVLEAGPAAGGVRFAHGILDVGEPMATPAIRQLKQWALMGHGPDASPVVIDAPPGTSCPVVEACRGADYLLLVTEPTPFGLHDLRLAVAVAAELDIPAGLIINRDGVGSAEVEAYCADAGVPILLRIPFERAIAEGVAQGQTLVQIHPEYLQAFNSVYGQIAGAVAKKAKRPAGPGCAPSSEPAPAALEPERG